VKLLKMMMLGVRSPQSIACGVDASVSRIELYNYDRFEGFIYVLLRDTYVCERLGSARLIYKIAPPLISANGSKRVNPERKRSERVVTLLTCGDPRVEPPRPPRPSRVAVASSRPATAAASPTHRSRRTPSGSGSPAAWPPR
jgi:hypothetical protein